MCSMYPAVQLCIGDSSQGKSPICISASIDAPVLYENVSVPMRNTAREVLKTQIVHIN